MANIQIVTDTGHNLPETIAQRIPMLEIPFHIEAAGESYQDNNISLAFLAGLLERAKGNYPTTSAPNQQEFVNAYKDAETRSDGVLVVTIGSNFSTTHSNAHTAVSMYREQGGKLPIEIIDSMGGTMTQGFLLMEADSLKSEGNTLVEIASGIRRSAALSSNLVFTVRETTYLYRSGRVGVGAHTLASALRIKPILVLEGGYVNAKTRVRTLRRSVERVAEEVISRSKGKVKKLAIIGGFETNDYEALAKDLILSGLLQPPREIIHAKMCPAFMVHVGPHAVGAAWI